MMRKILHSIRYTFDTVNTCISSLNKLFPSSLRYQCSLYEFNCWTLHISRESANLGHKGREQKKKKINLKNINWQYILIC